MLTARWGHSATLLSDGTVLVTSGHGRNGALVSTAELYDPDTGSWTIAAADRGGDGDQTATLLRDGSVLVAGAGSADLYDPLTGTWTTTGEMLDVPQRNASSRLPEAAARLSDGRVLLATGASAQVYDPSNGSWTATGSMGTGRAFVTLTELKDGNTLVAGGWEVDDEGGFIGSIASAELYLPEIGTWSPTEAMVSIHGRFASQTPLPNGTVLVAGGVGTSNWLASAELYDPISGTWTATASLKGARYGHTATLLPGGTVLVAGGYVGPEPGTILSSCELYEASDGS
jgi:hypothetical protein